MRRIHFAFVFCLSISLHGSVLFSQGNPSCLSSEVTRALKDAFPNGMPGRIPPSTDKADYGFSFVIPVVVHVMHDNGEEMGVTQSQIASQIEVLNEDFNRYGNGNNTHESGADVQISFCLATRDPEGNPHPGFELTAFPAAANLDPFVDDTLMKRLNQWDPARYLNVWTVRRISGGDIRGYAYFPEDAAGTIWDGLVVDHRYFGRAAGTAISLGRTATHEAGHYLGLMHPWGSIEDACYLEDDGCEDTPEVYNQFFASTPLCLAPLSCDGTARRQVENYMDYSADGCLDMFTHCQAEIMRGNVARYRGSLVGLENLESTGCVDLAITLESDEGFYVFPNPVSDYLILFAGGADDGSEVKYSLYDMTGRLIATDRSLHASNTPWSVDFRMIRPGMYGIRVEAGDKVWTRQIVVAR